MPDKQVETSSRNIRLQCRDPPMTVKSACHDKVLELPSEYYASRIEAVMLDMDDDGGESILEVHADLERRHRAGMPFERLCFQ